MDKYEYNLKLDQMKALVAEGDYKAAAEIADTINWRKIKNVTALVRAGEIYEQVGRYEESRDILLMAYERSPIGRTIIYRLACVAVKMANFDEARDYYNEFVEIAPHDNLKYVLKYEIHKEEGADYNTLIGILEELKEQEFTEEWGYELARLYHQAGMIEPCIGVCDEIILYFGQGSYVEKALELKMLYQPLTPIQEEKYRQSKLWKEDTKEPESDVALDTEEAKPEAVLESETVEFEAASELQEPVTEVRVESEEVEVSPVELSPERFNTQNLQEALKESMQKIMEATERETVEDNMEAIKKMVEDIPYLQIPTEEEETEPEIEPEQAEILDVVEEIKEELVELEEIKELPEDELEDSLEFGFSEFLNEEYDGQMSILLPEESLYEPQVAGQMTIEDVLAEQQKAKEAAEAALREEEKKKLESVKAKALQEAEDIMERLADVIPRLDAGFTSRNLIKEKYLAGEKVEDDHAVQMVANMNQLLQQEIDRLSTENAQIEEQLAVEQEFVAAQEFAAGIQEMAESEIHFEEVPVPIEVEEIPEVKFDEVKIEEPFVDLEEAVLEFTTIVEETVEAQETEDSLEVEELPTVELTADLDFGAEITELTAEQKELFSYITPIKGMEEQICTALNGIIGRMKMGIGAKTGNLVVEGGSGSGKTVFATNFIKVLQQITGKPNGKVGKVEADVLNNKDVCSLYGKIAGGCLIVESAGDLTETSAENLALLMEQDANDTLVILEDSKHGIEKLFVRNKEIASKFSERIRIPIFTNDELVVFAKAYAAENGYVIDEMGVLALYNCISNIQKLDRETTIAEVKEIVDDAIKHVESGAFRKAFSIFTSSRFDVNDYVILHEKDFNN